MAGNGENGSLALYSGRVGVHFLLALFATDVVVRVVGVDAEPRVQVPSAVSVAVVVRVVEVFNVGLTVVAAHVAVPGVIPASVWSGSV